MLSNATCTLYHDNGNGYTTTYIDRCCWQDREAIITGKDGQTRSAGVRLYIPNAVKLTYDVAKDFFVKGKGAPINNTSASTISASIKALGKLHSIESVSEKAYGSASAQHYEFTLR